MSHNTGLVSVDNLYHTVIEEVITEVREAALDEGIDEQVLHELKQLWEQKLKASKALDPAAAPSTSRRQQTHTQPEKPAVHHAQSQPVDLSGAATAATMALPQIIQQGTHNHIFAGNIQIPQGSNYTIVPGSQYPLHIQPVQTTHQPIQIRPQNLSAKQVHHQLDGAMDDVSCTTAESFPVRQIKLIPTTSSRSKKLSKRSRLPKEGDEVEIIIQLDGGDNDTSDEDDIPDDDEDEDGLGEGSDDHNDEESLNSNDDVDADETTNLFETDNVVVCQYDKITRAKNRWRFILKDGIMNIKGKDYVFHKANGEAEW